MHPEMPADADHNFTDQDVGKPAQPCTASTRIHDVRLLNETTSFGGKVKKAKATTHRVASDVGHASKTEILDAMRLVESGDILTWSLHTWFPKSEEKNPDPVATGIRSGTLLPSFLSDGDAITTAEFLAALRVGKPPAVVIMCGCATQQFIQAVLGVGVAVAFGVGRHPTDGNPSKQPFPTEYQSIGAYDGVAAALMNGESLADAADAGTTALNHGRFSDKLFTDFRFRSGLDQKKSLEDNSLL
jgi:hypothetical protein